MSVLACNRRNCENIMCDRLSNTHGYICDECFEELVKSGVKTDIEEFMNTPKPKTLQEDIVRRMFKAEFRLT